MKVVNFRNGAAKLLLVVCFVMCAGSVFAQHRYFCELKSVENNASSSMYVIFDFGTRSSYNLLGVDNDTFAALAKEAGIDPSVCQDGKIPTGILINRVHVATE